MVACNPQAKQCLQTPAFAKVSSEAVVTCEEALKADLDRRDLFHQYVSLLRERGRYAEIVAWSRRILEHDPARTDALYYLAYSLRKTGQGEEALAKYKEVAERKPDDPDPYYGIALTYEALGDRNAARAAYSAYIDKEDRDNYQGWVKRARSRIEALAKGAPLGVSTVATGASSAAQAPDSTASAAPTGGTTASTPAGRAELGTKGASSPPAPATPTAATPAASAAPADCSAHKAAFKSNPFDTEAYSKFAECALAAGKQDEVIKHMRIATRDNPDYARGWLYLGRAYTAAGRSEDAKHALERACEAGIQEACGG
jgi:tetratricopeptide (TPR) repeat protein